MKEEQRHQLEKALMSLDKSELIKLLVYQAEQLEKVDQLEAEVKRLQELLKTSLRSEKRQAAPFGKKEVQQNPKPRGRKGGHKGKYRTASGPISEYIESPLAGCPNCGGGVEGLQALDQIIEESPKVSPRIIQLRTWQGHCRHCGKVRSSHALQVGTAQGSAKVQLGPRALSWVLKMRHRYGISISKSCDLLQDAFGLPLSGGAVSQIEQRMAKKLMPDYVQLLEQARSAEHIHVDETSWYVGSPKWWLWTFANDDMTIYEVDQSRGKDVLERILGKSFQGILISDCLSPYEDFCEKQQKCYAHHLKAIKDALLILPNSQYLRVLRRLLRKAILYKQCKTGLPPPDYQVLCQHLENWADLLVPTTLNEKGKSILDVQACPFKLLPTEQQLANRIAKRRKHLFTFLYHDQVSATNNLAERQLRPAVIQRKISCGNKTPKGAQAWKILRSVYVSNQQQQKDFSQSIVHALQRNLLER